jgi:glycosyltransferase involved in cell wall biosynthesis
VARDVSLPGFDPNPLPYMKRASVFVMSSAWEGFGHVLLEALACGCPVVSTDCPSGPSEILEAGALGPLVPVRDDAALALAIQGVLDDPPDRARLEQRIDAFSIDRISDRYLDILLG